MRIKFVEIQNFRKLKSIRIDFASTTTLFVGANNSGKTSAIEGLGHFLVDQDNFTTNDFTLSNWARINEIGRAWEGLAYQPGSLPASLAEWEAVLPSLDLWLDVGGDEIRYVSHLLPTLEWEGGLIGVRLRFEPKNVEGLSKEYVSAVRGAKETRETAQRQEGSALSTVALWPRTLQDFLERRLRTLFRVNVYSLDPSRQRQVVNGMASPQSLPAESVPIEGDPLRGLIRIDMIYAQRDFADVGSRDRLDGGARRETRRLSAQLLSYYDKHLNPLESPEPSDLYALRAIQDAEKEFDVRLRVGFSGALKEVETLGYPGVTDPKLTIATKIRLTDGLDHKAAVQYDVAPDEGTGGSSPLRLPEDYSGLGYQNLISMVFKLMSFRDGWMQVGKAAKTASAEAGPAFFPPPLHLVLIEEPEVHLHAQVQQVFIRKAYGLLRNHGNLGSNTKLATQLVVSTHSSHVAHECEFSCLRYFRRRPAMNTGEVPTTTVVNLREVFGDAADTQRFVARYLKATHCDLFFADAAILVEGPAERILVPHFIRGNFPELSECYVTLLEIGGSHAHRLRPLIDHLGLITLVITDLDAMQPATRSSLPPCRGNGQVTRNATLKNWLPRIDSLDDLLDAGDDQKVQKSDDFFSVRVAYQSPVQVTLSDGAPVVEALPNTFEDALAYDNLQVFRGIKGNSAIEEFSKAMSGGNTAETLGNNMSDILGKLKKAEFALDLLELEQDPWPIKPPTYICEGLSWLQQQLKRKQKEVLMPSMASAVAEEAVVE